MPDVYAFCGFYVAKAGGNLFNKTSQVILVRDGDRTVVTMSNDFEGAAQDFAMVIPVPELLKRNQIRLSEHSLFTKFDDYSAPRMAEYYDEAPCYEERLANKEVFWQNGFTDMALTGAANFTVSGLGVTVEAKYDVGEYDILILSAKESNGLKTWLVQNGYKMPNGAEEVLEPYIKSGMKFFVAKVDQKRLLWNTKKLTPLQVEFNTDKFMLPIRLGMANAKGNQDMIVYTITRKGRVETANYRTVKIPTDNEIPTFVQNDFGNFYKQVFDRTYKKSDGKSVYLEYAWDLSPTNPVKCDPCVGSVPTLADMSKAGANWVNMGKQGNVFFTRLHVRYNRQDFPQDLMFHETANQEKFQGRYVIRHPYTGTLTCDNGLSYLEKLVIRREEELHELGALTGWDLAKHQDYVSTYQAKLDALRKQQPKTNDEQGALPSQKKGQNNVAPDQAEGPDQASFLPGSTKVFFGGLLLVIVAFFALGLYRENRFQKKNQNH